MGDALPNHLSRHRKEAGLHQREVAVLLGYADKAPVARQELDQRLPRLEVALAYAATLGVSVEELFPGRFERAQRQVRARARQLARRMELEGVERPGAIAFVRSLADGADVRFEPLDEV